MTDTTHILHDWVREKDETFITYIDYLNDNYT
jgi:hypothetical protein